MRSLTSTRPRLLWLAVVVGLLASPAYPQAMCTGCASSITGAGATGDVLCRDAGGNVVACDTVSAHYASSRLFVPNLSVQPGTDSTTCVQFLDADGGTPVFSVDCTGELVGIGTASPVRQLSVAGSAGDVAILVQNTAGAASNHAFLQIYQSSSTGGDSYLQFRNSASDWAMGMDRSASNSFKISGSGSPGTSDYMVITTGGAVGIGPSNIAPTGTLDVKDEIDTTGNTEAKLREGASITNDLLQLLTDGDVEFMSFSSSRGLDTTTGTITFADSANIASATTTALGTGNLFHVTGTTTITTLNTCGAANDGRLLTLIFDGVLTLTDGNNLKLAGDFVTTADDVIQLVCDGSNWYESSRSVN
jgi:hypothetical protein